MLLRHMDVILGMAYPLSRTGDEQDRELSKAVLEGGIIGANFTRAALLGPLILPHPSRRKATACAAAVRVGGLALNCPDRHVKWGHSRLLKAMQHRECEQTHQT